jgi:hypothetical protein
MTLRDKRLHPALKHGGYSAATVLPGEDRGAFEKLHLDLTAEFCPAGALEEDIVKTIAHLMWRKENLGRVAGFGLEIQFENLQQSGEAVTISTLLQDLSIRDRLDSCIDRCLKRLLFVRGLKSISQGSSGAPRRQLTAPN